MNPLWKVYKSKVLKTLNPDMEEDVSEEVTEAEGDMTPVQGDEGLSAVSQLAKKVQGAGAKSWRSVSALFNKDDEHQLLESEPESPPVTDHPLATKPEEPKPNKRASAFWDSFSTKWHQAAAQRQAEAAAETEAAGEGVQEQGGESRGRSQEGGENQDGQESEVGGGDGGGGGGSGNSFSKYATLGGGGEDTAFKWNFVTSKLAELKTKSMAAKSN